VNGSVVFNRTSFEQMRSTQSGQIGTLAVSLRIFKEFYLMGSNGMDSKEAVPRSSCRQ
jgi:hypothetical protein